jgi:hypothetical protein
MPAPKPSLDGIIQKKGTAQPSAAVPQRGSKNPAPPPAAEDVEPKTRSLTLKLSERDYQRLRQYAFAHNLSHQAVMESALLEHLTRAAAK